MKITKFGHCCLLVEEGNLRVLTDPGSYSTGQNRVRGVDLILITHHEHQDHLSLESLRAILQNNPSARIITNSSVRERLSQENIPSVLLEEGGKRVEKGVVLEGVGERHAVIYHTFPLIQNTSYIISDRFFYPGDAFNTPGKTVEILALPVAAPWLKLSESIDFAVNVKPEICFPVHDANLRSPDSIYHAIRSVLEPAGIRFIVPEIEKQIEF